MKINREDCTGLVVDVQERLFPVIHGKEELLKKCLLLLEGLRTLQVPVLVTEQYPKGLGPTLQPLQQVVETFSPIEKLSFSCCGAPDFITALEQLSHKKVIICGIEAHVCVLQTVVDLLGSGYVPVVVVDCIASRNPGDKSVALERMKMEGAMVATCESILFELASMAGTDQFKAISRLVKQ
jgi:nicotinamidase-related amidase